MPRRLRAFKRWMKANNIEYSNALDLCIGHGSVSGVGVKALCDLKEGDLVATIPKKTCLTIKTSTAVHMIEKANECMPLVWSSNEVDTLLAGTALHKAKHLVGSEGGIVVLWPCQTLVKHLFPRSSEWNTCIVTTVEVWSKNPLSWQFLAMGNGDGFSSALLGFGPIEGNGLRRHSSSFEGLILVVIARLLASRGRFSCPLLYPCKFFLYSIMMAIVCRVLLSSPRVEGRVFGLSPLVTLCWSLVCLAWLALDYGSPVSHPVWFDSLDCSTLAIFLLVHLVLGSALERFLPLALLSVWLIGGLLPLLKWLPISMVVTTSTL
eukprot:Gb_10888 [translate_table: standard]